MKKLYLLSIIFLIGLSYSVFADLTCTVENALVCTTGTKIMAMSNYTNAHAEEYDQGNADYDYAVCCWDTNAVYTITNVGNDILRLNLTTNSHVENATVGSPDYLIDVEIGASGTPLVSTQCLHTEDASCPQYYTCVVTVNETDQAYPGTNMHVATCNASQAPYDEKLCCGLFYDEGGLPQAIPEFSVMGLLLTLLITLIGAMVIVSRAPHKKKA